MSNRTSQIFSPFDRFEPFGFFFSTLLQQGPIGSGALRLSLKRIPSMMLSGELFGAPQGGGRPVVSLASGSWAVEKPVPSGAVYGGEAEPAVVPSTA